MVTVLPGVIIAAGKGERLRGGVKGIPKPLVELDGESLLVRQARAMLAVGARPVFAMVNSETAHLASERAIALPADVSLLVRDTANSMETLFALADVIERKRFLAATVDAILPRHEFKRFSDAARQMWARDRLGGVLGVVRWRGETRPLFAEISGDGLVRALGGEGGTHITAGVYLFSTNVFRFVAEARRAGLTALREFLGFLLAERVRLAAIELSDAVDIDEAADLATAEKKLKEWARDGANRAAS